MSKIRSAIMKARWSNPEFRQRMVQENRKGRSRSTKYTAADECIRVHRLRKLRQQAQVAQVVHDSDNNH